MVTTKQTLPLILALTACVPDDGHDKETGYTEITATSVATIIVADPAGLDSTGAAIDPCADDYDGNHDLGSAHPLLLDTADNAWALLGDGILSGTSSEQGQDRLAVCSGRPDFFSFDAACPSYLVVDTHGSGGGDLDLVVHFDGMTVVEAIGTWEHFFVKPAILPVDAGTHTLEVRHSGNGAPEYALHTLVLPIAPCS